MLQAGQLTLLAALVEPVQTAMYWQEPGDDDHALSAREVRDALLPVAQAVTVAPEATMVGIFPRGLAGRYPVEVSRSRRHDEWRATGWAGRWFIPGFAAAAADYDAVHLSITGYLTTAGRALPVNDGRTVRAGWDPGQA